MVLCLSYLQNGKGFAVLKVHLKFGVRNREQSCVSRTEEPSYQSKQRSLAKAVWSVNDGNPVIQVHRDFIVESAKEPFDGNFLDSHRIHPFREGPCPNHKRPDGICPDTVERSPSVQLCVMLAACSNRRSAKALPGVPVGFTPARSGNLGLLIFP